MQLIITVRKEVETPERGKEIYDLVKVRLANRPDLVITGHVTNHFTIEPEPE